MDFGRTMREAARRADRATRRAMEKLRNGLTTDEDDLTGVLVGNLDAELEGRIGDLIWSTSIVRHRRGVAAEERAVGADIVIHVMLQSAEFSYSKGVLIQAKRVEPYRRLVARDYDELIRQCRRMLDITPASFVFDYTGGGVRCCSAVAIGGSSNRNLHQQCRLSSYRFFLDLFECTIGDPNITSARVRDLPVPTVVQIKASDRE